MFEGYYQHYHQHLGNAASDFQPTDEASLMLTFANEQTISSLGVVNMPCRFGASWGSVPVHVLDAPSPLLLGVDIMCDLELNTNFSTRLAHSGRLKQGTCLQSMGTTHWAIDPYAVKSGDLTCG